ncbi:MAG: hypothetical protein HQL26_00375 [Candidatus Omnitrophica bacterium]|nr:hypothetical protein [Candidatus Omnitrophota bacterium]
MFSPIKNQMVSFLTEQARAGIKKLDKNSLAAQELSELDVDTVLKEDIQQFCDVMTFPEMVKIMSLGATIKLNADSENAKADIKKIAKTLVERVEKKQVKIKTPESCRELLFNL